MDPDVRSEAKSTLSTLFQGIGRAPQDKGGTLGGLGLTQQLTEFVEMPLELANTFLNMSVQLSELVLQTLEQAGMELVKGLTPA